MASDDEDSIKPFYLREFKKGGKGLGARLHDLSTDELLELIRRINEDTPENVIRKEEIGKEIAAGAEKVTEQEKKYFIDKKGKHAKYKDKPKSYTLKKGQEKEQAAELISEHAYAAIEREFGEETAKGYREHPERVMTYLAGRGINFYTVQKHLVDNPRNINSQGDGAYFQLKQSLSVVDNEEGNLEQILEGEIREQTAHHESTKKWASKHAKSENFKIKPSADVSQYLDVAKKVLRKEIDEAYRLNTGYIEPTKSK